MEAEDASKTTGEVRVMQKLTEKCRSKSKYFDPNNLAKNHSIHGGGREWKTVIAMLKWRKSSKIPRKMWIKVKQALAR